MDTTDGKLTRIGVFYDGNFFFHVSNFYQYHHQRQARIGIRGLHEFVRDQVAKCEGVDVRYCQIVDAHYFRGRFRAAEASDRDLLLKERAFDDVLMREGVTTHYLPRGPEGEKGVDVWLALEAFELAVYKRFNVSVLVACDGDFLPLVRKLNTLGTRVMVLAWDFKYVDQNGEDRETRTAQVLLDEATYPVMMHQIIEDRSHQSDALVNAIFLPRKEISPGPFPPPAEPPPAMGDGAGAPPPAAGQIKNLKEGFGFVAPDSGGPNIFFHYTDLRDVDFADLKLGDRVQFLKGQNPKGPCAREVRRCTPPS
jgi:cold shock CspA family protein